MIRCGRLMVRTPGFHPGNGGFNSPSHHLRCGRLMVRTLGSQPSNGGFNSPSHH